MSREFGLNGIVAAELLDTRDPDEHATADQAIMVERRPQPQAASSFLQGFPATCKSQVLLSSGSVTSGTALNYEKGHA